MTCHRRGPKVDEYLRSVGLNPAGGSYAWCAAFVCWCFGKGAAAEARSKPSLVKPGQVFVLSAGGGLGHVGIVESADSGVLTTIEGNTNDGGSREGIGVFRRTGPNGRKITSINKGFLEVG